jgi:outer membrane murein-binding lipoprotein Lpp
MNVSMLVFTIVIASITVAGAFTGTVWWFYRRGYVAGKKEAGLDAARTEIDALKLQVAKLAADQTKRRR